MKLIKKRILWLILLVPLIIMGCEREGSSSNFDINYKMENNLLLEMDATKENLCIVTAREHQGNVSAIIPKRYIALIEAEGKKKNFTLGVNLIQKYSYKKFLARIYSLETRELVKSYRIEDMIKEVPSDYHISPSLPMCFRNNGQDYLRLNTSYVGTDPTQTTRFYLIINVDTDEMSFVDIDTYYDEWQESGEKASRYLDQLHIFSDWTQEPNCYQFLSANGFIPLLWEDYEPPTKPIYFTTSSNTRGFINEGIAEVEIKAYALPEENKELYSKFPGLKQYQGQEDLVAQIFLGNYPSAEEIMKLFLEEGQEISFEGCVMDGKYSIDGLPHEINGFEEFDQWFKPSEY